MSENYTKIVKMYWKLGITVIKMGEKYRKFFKNHEKMLKNAWKFPEIMRIKVINHWNKHKKLTEMRKRLKIDQKSGKTV